MRKLIFLPLLVLLAACDRAPSAPNGTGYRYVRFSTPAALRAVAADPLASPAIIANNEQCEQDAGCRK
jgi:hypothetical protein